MFCTVIAWLGLVKCFFDRVFVNVITKRNKMTLYKVKNMQGTSEKRPPYPYDNKSWLEYWQIKTGKKAFFCSRFGCINYAEHGGHVRICDGMLAGKAFIVPLCRECNNPANTSEFYVDCELCEI